MTPQGVFKKNITNFDSEKKHLHLHQKVVKYICYRLRCSCSQITERMLIEKNTWK